jgi:Sec-independent protein translocase protein TatA
MQDIGLVLVIILILVLLWRGPKTLPKLGNALGRGVREAREEASKVQADIQSRTSSDAEATDTEASDAQATDAAATEPTDAEAADATVAPEPTDRPPGAA